MSVRDSLVNIIIKAKDLGSKPIKGFERRLNSLDNTVTRVAASLAAFFGARALIGFFKDAVTGAASFEEQMSKVQAVSNASAEEMAMLTEEAQRLGRETVFTATQAGEGLEILARAGLSASQQVAALGPVLNTAQAEGMGLAEAAGYITDTLSIFNLEASKSGEVSDLMAKGASIANTSIADLGQAIRESGGLARSANLTLADQVAILDQLANNGLRGSKAGTGLKSILAQLANPASTARKELSKLGIKTGVLSEVIDGLEESGNRGKRAMLAFGTEALPAIQALTNNGSKAIAGFKAELDKANGAAAKMAKIATDNLKGAFAGLGSAFDGIKQQLSAASLPVFTEQVKELTTSLQDLASDGSVVRFGVSLSKMFEDAGERLKTFLGDFDFSNAIEQISDFTRSTTSKLETAANWFGIFTNGILIASNSFAAGVKAVGGSVSFTLGEITGGIASFLDFVGASDMSRKAELMAEGFRDTAKGFKDGILEDSKDISRNWEEMQSRVSTISRLKSKERQRILDKEAKAAAKSGETIGESFEDAIARVGDAMDEGVEKTEELTEAAVKSGSILAETFRSLTLADTKEEIGAVKESLDDMLSDGKINQFQYNVLLADTEKKLAAIAEQARITGQAQTEAAKQATDAATKTGEAGKQAASGARSAAQALARVYEAARDGAHKLSGATGALFDKIRGISTTEATDEMGRLNASIAKTKQNLASLQRTSIDGFSGIIGAAKKMYAASEAARLSFYNQTKEATRLALALESVDSANAGVITQARRAAKSLDLLDNTTLDRLTASIAAAESRLNSMSDSAASAVASLRDELDQINQDYESIEQREYNGQRAELMQLVAEASKAGNTQANKDAREALQLLDQVHSKRMASIQAERQAEATRKAEQERSAAAQTQPSSDSGSSKTIRLQLAGPDGSETAVSLDSEADVEKILQLLQQAGLSTL